MLPRYAHYFDLRGVLMPSNKKVFLAVPAKDGAVKCSTVRSIIAGIRALGEAGYSVQYGDVPGDCYVQLARNHLVKKFLESDCMDMIFIDADVDFPESALVRLMSYDVQLVGGAYRYRKDEEDYPVRLCVDGSLRAMFNPDSGLIYAQMVPTGLMRINRTVFSQMQMSHPRWLKRLGADDNDLMWHFFQTGDLWYEGKWWGEDVAFCRYCREEGVQVWIDPNIDLGHTGEKRWSGNYHQYLLRQPKPEQLVKEQYESLVVSKCPVADDDHTRSFERAISDSQKNFVPQLSGPISRIGMLQELRPEVLI
jgi:hypothetical protein